MPFGAILAAAAPFILKGMDIGGGRAAQQMSYEQQRALNADQYAHDMNMMRYQNKYNSPAEQMSRFLDAGLNPNLVYGQGTPGNMESAPRYPHQEAKTFSYLEGQGTSLLEGVLRSRLMSSQADLTDQRVKESGIKQDLMKSQKNLVDANPYLNKAYVDAMVTNLQAVAAMKDQQAGFMLSKTVDDDGVRWERGYLKMQKELDLLSQKYNLGEADQKLKASVLTSKAFQNELSKIQVQWMKDSEITPQHIYLGIMMLLQKMM